MIRPHRFTALLVLLLLAGCTVERRSAGQEEGGSSAGEDTTAGAVEARAFLHRLQEARRTGRTGFVRERLDPGAVLVLDGRTMEGAGGRAAAERIVELPAASESGEISGVELGGSEAVAAYVLRYPPDSPGGRRPLETVVMTPDSAGWTIHLFVRSFEGADPPGS